MKPPRQNLNEWHTQNKLMMMIVSKNIDIAFMSIKKSINAQIYILYLGMR